MRIIKTVIRKKSLKLIGILLVTFFTPVAAILSTEILPEAVNYMSEAAKYSVVSRPLAEKVGINNGEQLLFSPSENNTDDEPAAELPVFEEQVRTAERLSLNISEEHEDLTLFSAQSGRIYEETFRKGNGENYINLQKGGQVRNCTELDNSFVAEEALKPSNIGVELYSQQPQVLIMHTHTSESYEPYEKDWFDESYTSRSADAGNSVVAVGEAIAEELSRSGISVIHDGTIHDEIYSGAYSRSLQTTLSILSEYPSIKIILDIHRDAIEYEDGSHVSAVAEIDGKKAAQVMIISAADEGSYDIPNYLGNFHFACEFQQAMEQNYSGLTRPVLFQYCQYNQQVSTGSLLVEVGSHGNTVEQAVYSGHLIGKALSRLLLEKAEESYMSDGRDRNDVMPLYFIKRLR